jgi:hypothetical protein
MSTARATATVAIFAGQSVQLRARDDYDAIERGALNSRIADAELAPAKAVFSSPKKRRLVR